MTSFHDILGTNQDTPQSDIKRRYKHLSNRSHPDKGGSKALMQLISEAYKYVSEGKGQQEAFNTEYVQTKSVEKYLSQIHRLQNDYRHLKEERDTLVKKLASAQKEAQQAFADSSMHIHNMKNTASNDVGKLQEENIRLAQLLAEAKGELAAKNQSHAVSSSGNNAADPTVLTQKVASQIKSLGYFNAKRVGLVLLVPVMLIVLLLSAGKAPWLAVFAWFNHQDIEPNAIATIVDVNPLDVVNNPIANQVETTVVLAIEPEPIARIQIDKVIGQWQLKFYEDSQKPYIAVRSDKGSYIVKSCDSGFEYYLNETVRARRLSANMIFDRKERHFIVYDIPYGKGSSAANWSDSKSVLLNEEYFSNTGFSEAFGRLNNACVSSI
ncbi:DnaJ domain-containing protein [Photobacterium profundum]|uniref:DnaJ domain-containing protein n=1 Tax=Photobacterium profundum TaxID=74109 RepID=UPI003D09F905